jgi:hypothetical protein
MNAQATPIAVRHTSSARNMLQNRSLGDKEGWKCGFYSILNYGICAENLRPQQA